MGKYIQAEQVSSAVPSNDCNTILHVLWKWSIGGISKVVLDLARAQDKEYEKVAVYLVGGRKIEDAVYPDINTHCGGLRTPKWCSIGSFLSMVRLFNKYTIVHTHSFNVFVSMACLLSGSTIVHTIHGGRGINGELNHYRRMMNRLFGIYLNRVAHAVVANSFWTAKMAVKVYRIKDDKIGVVHNGVSVRAMEMEGKMERDPNQFIVGTISRFVPSKRIDIALRVFGTLCSDIGNAKMLLVGSGPQDQYLRRCAEKMIPCNSYMFTGYIPEPSEEIKKFDIAILPAKNEPFGLVAIEIMLLGKKVFVFNDGGGMTEIIARNEADSVAESEEDMVNKIISYWGKYINEGDENGASRRKKYASQYSTKNMVSGYDYIYNDVARGRRIKP